MEVKLEEWISPYEMGNMIKEEFRKQLVFDEEGLKRIISNQAYSIVYKMVDDAFDDKLETLLKRKIVNIISELREYCIFNKPSAWSRETNTAYDIMRSAIHDNQQLIKDKTKECIESNIDAAVMKQAKEDLRDMMVQVIEDRFFGGEDNE